MSGKKDLVPITPNSRSQIARVPRRIETRPDGPLPLTALAASEGIGPFHLGRTFSLLLDQSPMPDVTARRPSEAAFALKCTDAKVIEIGHVSGHESQEGFTRAFLDQFRHAPSTLRGDDVLSPTLKGAFAFRRLTTPD